MKVLTVSQPWAWAIIHGPKRIENRTWPTSYRGPLLIHAGKSKDWLGERTLEDGTPVPPVKDLVFGAIIGLVDLVDCVPLAKARNEFFAEGPWCFRVENPRPLAPMPCRGNLLLWDLPLTLAGPLERLLK